MPKAKPDKVIVHRIELQDTERELVEMAIAANAFTQSLEAITPILVPLTDPTRLYGFLTILELLALLETPLPTLGDNWVKEWVNGAPFTAASREANQEAQETLAVQANNSLKEADNSVERALQSYNADPNPQTRAILDSEHADRERIRGEAHKRSMIAKGWKYKFRYENQRWPNRGEVLAAKIRGDYY